ncbi:hypothetical protein Tco_1433454, partial [Tanacetum coccineum]
MTNEEHNEVEEVYDDELNIEEEEKIDNEEKMDEEEDDEVTKELYDDVNVNLGNEDTYMTYADQGASEQQNVSQESGLEQEEEDAHVTLTPPSIEENGVIRPKKYSELSATKATQADCDIKATNIILQGLPPEVYALVSN